MKSFQNSRLILLLQSGSLVFLMELEQKAIEKAMKKCEGNISRAAEMLGITRFALYRKLEKYEI